MILHTCSLWWEQRSSLARASIEQSKASCMLPPPWRQFPIRFRSLNVQKAKPTAKTTKWTTSNPLLPAPGTFGKQYDKETSPKVCSKRIWPAESAYIADGNSTAILSSKKEESCEKEVSSSIDYKGPWMSLKFKWKSTTCYHEYVITGWSNQLKKRSWKP